MSEAARKTGTRDVLRALRQPKVLAMLLLGFSSGLPLYLVGNTMGYWMREGGSELSAIGFLSWVGLAYTLKFLWAPIIDKTDVPLLGRLGHRRGWIVPTQALRYTHLGFVLVLSFLLFPLAARSPLKYTSPFKLPCNKGLESGM